MIRKRIFYDGLNLALRQGTGIATYTRVLANLARDLGNETGALYSTDHKPPSDPVLRKIIFLDELGARRRHSILEPVAFIADCLRWLLPIRIVMAEINDVCTSDRRLPPLDYVFLARKVFKLAHDRFVGTGRFTTLTFPVRPDIMHCTYQLPVHVRSACNVYTIHDLVPLRLPFATLDNKRRTYRLLKKIAAEADHIVTVSEHSRRDIIELLGVEEGRVTNTYQAVAFPEEYIARSEQVVSDQLAGLLGLDFQGYLLFFGAIEPKKNVRRLLEAYFSSGVHMPLVIVSSRGWGNDDVRGILEKHRGKHGSAESGSRRVQCIIQLDHAEPSMLATLIKGARAVVFPSLYEGFGLPVVEAMALGTPVLTSRVSSLPEIAGDAALLVDPYRTDDIARGIATICEDNDMRKELAQRGRVRAKFFSVDRYRQRVEELYSAIG
jgi:glycosyltransferase involved in cell wall biosynthesis